MELAITQGKFLTFITEYFGIESFWDVLSAVLDIAIIAFLIYGMFKIFRGTKAFSLLKGILVVFVISVIARLFKLTTVTAVLDIVLNVLPVLAVVLFAPEIRKLLENIGKKKFSDLIADIAGKRLSANEQLILETNEMIDEVVSSVDDMSKTYTGALIVFEREDSLDGWDEQGTPIDAKVQSRLLEQIFIKNTPLHDGAVLIRKGRISAAQCVLPLTKNKDISRNLGTRHMAALGASESADCIVVVVSEETGMISVTNNGEIERGLDKESLRRILSKELVPEDSENKESVLRRIFKKKENNKE